MTEERLHACAAAWARHDVETLMTFLTEDCLYQASVGPEPGKTYVGREAVRQGVIDMLAHDAPGQSRSGPVFICGDKGVAQWPYAWTAPDGQVTELRGCDMYEFRDDKIRRNNAFRKTWKERRQGKMLQLTPGYAPRPVRFLALWEWHGWRMKVYGISAHAEYPQRRFARAIPGKITRIDLASSDSVPGKL